MFDKLKWKFAKFMYGRYGFDQLYITGGIIFLVLQLLQIFVHIPFLNIISLTFIGWVFFRVFSKNITARRAENQKFLNAIQFIKAKWKGLSRRLQDIKTHRYRKCPNCKTTLRLPRKRGTHKTRCPRCNHLFEVKIRI